MLWLYRLLFLPALLLLAPRYLLRMRRRGGYRANFSHRFGGHPVLPDPAPGRRRIWLQAVSVGEMLAIGPLLPALREAGAEIYLTTTTSTGYQLALERYASQTIGIGYFPIDAWPCVQRAWRRIRPDLVVLTEGERWPEHLAAARNRGVPVLAINARLSDRSFARLRRWPAAARLVTGGLTRVLAASAEDAARFAALGVPREKLQATGNLKLDVRIPRLAPEEAAALRAGLGLRATHLLLGSSTWPGEEAALLQAWRAARAAGIDCGLLLVPRHAERREEIARKLVDAGVRFHLRSTGPVTGEVDVHVADTTGELRRLTQLADLVFVGKSLPPHTEGQTPVEAAALEKAILFGPGMSNFRVIARELLAAGGARQVDSAEALASAAVQLLQSEPARAGLARAAANWHRENSGALERTLVAVQAEFGRVAPRR